MCVSSADRHSYKWSLLPIVGVLFFSLYYHACRLTLEALALDGQSVRIPGGGTGSNFFYEVTTVEADNAL